MFLSRSLLDIPKVMRIILGSKIGVLFTNLNVSEHFETFLKHSFVTQAVILMVPTEETVPKEETSVTVHYFARLYSSRHGTTSISARFIMFNTACRKFTQPLVVIPHNCDRCLKCREQCFYKAHDVHVLYLSSLFEQTIVY